MFNKIWVYVCLLVLVVVSSVGCATTKYVYQQPYQGILADVNLTPTYYGSLCSGGTIVLDESTVLIGRFETIRGGTVRELSIGATYRVMLIDESGNYNTYTIEKIKDK